MGKRRMVEEGGDWLKSTTVRVQVVRDNAPFKENRCARSTRDAEERS